MKRRALFGRLAAITAAVALAPAAKGEAAPSEDERIRALIDDVMANPDKHPLIMARVHELTGDARADGYNRGHDVGSSLHESRQMWAMGRVPPLTFEALQDWCRIRGCAVERDFSIDYRQHTFTHAPAGARVDEALVMKKPDPYRVYAWLRSLHGVDA